MNTRIYEYTHRSDVENNTTSNYRKMTRHNYSFQSTNRSSKKSSLSFNVTTVSYVNINLDSSLVDKSIAYPLFFVVFFTL